MGDCSSYWHKVQIIEDDIKQVEQLLYKVNIDLQSKPLNPAPLQKYKQELQQKLQLLRKKKEQAHHKAVSCEAKDFQQGH